MHRAGWILLIVVTVSACTQTPPAQKEPPSWQWSWEKIQATVNKVRAGKDLTPRSWPDKNKVAVGLSFDVDNETPSLRDNRLSPSELSQGEYGSRVAMKRILDLLDRYRIKATFFVPAVTAKLYPDDMKQIIAKGHEIGLHGWIHERNSLLLETDERQLMTKSLQTLTETSGQKPVGIRTPSWDYSPSTLKIIRELGLLYDSSLMADDRPYEVLSEGKPTGVVELPVEWILDDYPYYGMDRDSTVRPHLAPEDVLDIWTKEFDVAYQEGTAFILTMHPHISGHRSRMVVLEKLIQHINSKPGAWFARHEDIARAAKSQM